MTIAVDLGRKATEQTNKQTITKKIVTKSENMPILGIFSLKTILMFRVGLKKLG